MVYLFLRRAFRPRSVRRAEHCKLDQHAIASEFDDTTAMLRNLGIDHCLSNFFQLRERPSFVTTHQPTVPDDIGSENCSETAFHGRSGQKVKKVKTLQS